jgi:hypothetical protein
MDNTEIYLAAIHVAAIFTVAKIALHVFFPTFAGLVWQTMLAPVIVPRWSSFAQSDDQGRYSYLPTEPMLIYRIGLFPAPLRELATGVRDGFLIGVLFILVPTFVPLMRTCMLFWIMLRIWQISRCPSNATRVDEMFTTIHGLLLFIVAQEAVMIVGGQYGLPTLGH